MVATLTHHGEPTTMTDTSTIADLRTQFETADDLCKAIAAEEPLGDTVIEVRPPTSALHKTVGDEHAPVKHIRLFSKDQNDRLDAARRARLDLVMRLSRARKTGAAA